jgi:hypothetical protein
MEQWKPLVGFETWYSISDHGNVIRTATWNGTKIERARIPETQPNGYLVIALSAGGEKKRKYLHRAAWEAFRGPIPKGLEINHRNGVRTDNRLENLELVTRADNMVHGHRTMGRKGTKLTEQDVQEILGIISSGTKTQKQMASQYEVSQATISHIASGRNWKRFPRSNGE